MVNVQLESNATALADVVITGYQTLSKERATGSFEDKVDSSVFIITSDSRSSLRHDKVWLLDMQATEKRGDGKH